MVVGGQLHTPAVLRLEKEPTHLIGGWVGPRASLNMVVKRKNPCPCPGCPTCSLVSILTELP